MYCTTPPAHTPYRYPLPHQLAPQQLFFLALFPGTDSDLPFSLDFGRILLDRLCQTNNIIHH